MRHDDSPSPTGDRELLSRSAWPAANMPKWRAQPACLGDAILRGPSDVLHYRLRRWLDHRPLYKRVSMRRRHLRQHWAGQRSVLHADHLCRSRRISCARGDRLSRRRRLRCFHGPGHRCGLHHNAGTRMRRGQCGSRDLRGRGIVYLHGCWVNSRCGACRSEMCCHGPIGCMQRGRGPILMRVSGSFAGRLHLERRHVVRCEVRPDDPR